MPGENAMHPNQHDPVDDEAYPGITAPTAEDAPAPPDGWDTDPALAATDRAARPEAVEPDTAWELLRLHDGWAQ